MCPPRPCAPCPPAWEPHLGSGHTYAQLAAECRLEVLAALAPTLTEAIKAAATKAHVILDGTPLPIDRIASDRPFHSGKHKKHGMNLQVITDPAGRRLRAEWDFVRPLLPKSSRGRKRLHDRTVLNGVVWKFRTGTLLGGTCPSGTVRGPRCTPGLAGGPWTARSSGCSVSPRPRWWTPPGTSTGSSRSTPPSSVPTSTPPEGEKRAPGPRTRTLQRWPVQLDGFVGEFQERPLLSGRNARFHGRVMSLSFENTSVLASGPWLCSARRGGPGAAEVQGRSLRGDPS
jgi:hypothetical protein